YPERIARRLSQPPSSGVYRGKMKGKERRFFWLCLTLALLLWGLSFPLRCVGQATRVGGLMLLDGALLGAALAGVPRTRRPLGIYAWLGVALLTLWPLIAGWPAVGAEAVHPWRGAPSIVLNYFDMLRVGAFLLGIPYPFARLGQHAPDPLPERKTDVP